MGLILTGFSLFNPYPIGSNLQQIMARKRQGRRRIPKGKLFIQVEKPDGTTSFLDLSKCFAKTEPKVGAAAQLFYEYPSESEVDTVTEWAKLLSQDARNYLKINGFSDDPSLLEKQLQHLEKANDSGLLLLQRNNFIETTLGVELKEQAFPSSPYALLSACADAALIKYDKGLIRFKARSGFKIKAAAETIRSASRLEQAIIAGDANESAKYAALMILNGCRYGLSEELLVGHRWRAGQSKGGKKSGKTRQDESLRLHDRIRQEAKALENQGKPRRQLAGILSRRFGFTPNHIRRILRNR